MFFSPSPHPIRAPNPIRYWSMTAHLKCQDESNVFYCFSTDHAAASSFDDKEQRKYLLTCAIFVRLGYLPCVFSLLFTSLTEERNQPMWFVCSIDSSLKFNQDEWEGLTAWPTIHSFAFLMPHRLFFSRYLVNIYWSLLLLLLLHIFLLHRRFHHRFIHIHRDFLRFIWKRASNYIQGVHAAYSHLDDSSIETYTSFSLSASLLFFLDFYTSVDIDRLVYWKRNDVKKKRNRWMSMELSWSVKTRWFHFFQPSCKSVRRAFRFDNYSRVNSILWIIASMCEANERSHCRREEKNAVKDRAFVSVHRNLSFRFDSV